MACVEFLQCPTMGAELHSDGGPDSPSPSLRPTPGRGAGDRTAGGLAQTDQLAGGRTSNASSSTNETKHPAEGSQVWTRVRDSWWLVGCLRISTRSRSPVVLRLGGKSVEEDVHPLRTWGVTLGVQGVVACGWMWWMPGGGSVRS